jgi:AcrR family transcriptional regulator
LDSLAESIGYPAHVSVETMDSVPPRRRLAAPARRAAIVRAAVEVFASRGYGSPGMAEIAEAAGVTRAVLYDHFSSKRDLFISALNEQSAVFLGHVGAHIVSEAPPDERMRATIDAVFSFAERHPAAWDLLYKNDVHGDRSVDAAWQESRRSRTDEVTRMLEQDLAGVGVDVGTPRAGLIIEMLIGALAAGADAWRRDFPSVPREHVVDAAVRLLWPGMSSLS